MTLIQIDIIFDFVCAWCYITHRTLTHAINLYRKTYPGGRNDTIQLNWRAYYLNYNPHGHSVPKSQLLEERLGHQTAAQRTAMVQRAERAGRAVGIIFADGGMIGPDTRAAHRLVYLAGTLGENIQGSLGGDIQGELVEGLMGAYHCQGRDISEVQVLKEVGVAVGIEEGVLEGWLGGNHSQEEEKEKENGDEKDKEGENEFHDEAATAVDDEASRNKTDIANTGVPRVIIQGKYPWDGQDVYEFMEIMGKVKEEQLDS